MYEAAEDQDTVTDRQMMMSYFVSEFVPAVSVVATPQSYYTALYMPMAFDSEGVRSAIIACASLHASRHAVTVHNREQLLKLSTECQRSCHIFLKERIAMSGQPFKDAYQVVAVTLLLTGMEAISATGAPKWLQQLDCLRTMIRQLRAEGTTKYSSWALDCLYRHFTYHWAMAAVTSQLIPSSSSKRSTLVQPDTSVIHGSPESCTLPMSPATATRAAGVHGESVLDPLMGAGQGVFRLLCRIHDIKDASAENEAFRTLEHDLLAWRPDSALSYDAASLPAALDLIALAEACRLSGLLLLYRSVDKKHSSLAILATQIIHTVARIPMGSSAEAGLTFSLFLAGAEVQSTADRLACSARLAALQSRYRLENIAKAQAVHKVIYQRCADGAETGDWADIMLEKGWVISLS